MNFKSALTTTLIDSYETESPSLSFMYKIPEKQGKTDTLKLLYYSFNNYHLLTDFINPTNEWQEYQCSLDSLPNSFHFAFEATCAGGGGVFIDDILFYDNTVGVPIHEADKSQTIINLNQIGSSMKISFSSKENAIFNCEVYSIDGRPVYNEKSQNLPGGVYDKTIDLSSLKPGFYIVKINHNNTSLTKKVFIN
jgi:hypothetical protein